MLLYLRIPEVAICHYDSYAVSCHKEIIFNVKLFRIGVNKREGLATLHSRLTTSVLCSNWPWLSTVLSPVVL